MNLNTLKEFRHGMYTCFGHAKDALFNLVDALASEAGASSFPAHEVRNEVVEELILVGGAKVMQNRTLSL
jgi:hypothetical protein